MHPYIPNGKKEREEMLKTIGMTSMEDLFTDVPSDLRLKNGINLPNGISEFDVEKKVRQLSKKNTCTGGLACFMGAGAYDSYVPAAIKHLTSRSEFSTAYTPYQPEISQGTLQSIFEFQTVVCEVTGMEVANASMYDGATATAEAAVMAAGINNKKKVIVSRAIHPDTKRVLASYLKYRNISIVEAPVKDGKTDVEALKTLVDADTAAVLIQNPNFFGMIEDGEEIGKITHTTKALFVVTVADATSLAVIKSPAEMGADIAVGDGQAFGNGLGFGGPYVGFIATTTKYMRKMPGRICGETKDVDGKRAFVLTLQAREQHIRREKATSNICSNQALCALTATIYLSLLGKEGLKEVALQSASKARYIKSKLEAAGFKTLFTDSFFREFAVVLPEGVEKVNERLLENGILGGYDLGKEFPEYAGAMLLCATEKRTVEEMDKLVQTIVSVEVSK